jgi:NgoBV restriction endonuclease
MSAQKLYTALLASHLIGAKGEIYFELNNIKTRIQDSSVVGNIIQEWLQAFMRQAAIDYRKPDNSQEFPDFFLNNMSDKQGLLEVKCFKDNPNFDVANFSAYCRSLSHSPYRLDADYLLIKYSEQEDGLRIDNIWLKKVWEITSASERSAIKIQWKQNVAFNIRPATWYGTRAKYTPFKTRKDFVVALKTVLDTSQIGGDWRKNWFKTVSETYKQQTGEEL